MNNKLNTNKDNNINIDSNNSITNKSNNNTNNNINKDNKSINNTNKNINRDNKLTNNTNTILDFKLNKKQLSLLNVLSDPEYVNKINKEKAKLAGISEKTFYSYLRNPNFVKALHIRGLSESLACSLPVIKRMRRDALSGKFMQQKTMLEMSGHYTQQPLIQQVIQINQDQQPSEEVDQQIMKKIIDIVPTEDLSTELSPENSKEK